ncbi:MAG: ParB/RepB/Spo0J family partition protein [Actinomycetia bacterium]|nr:ParB/RepB/Spo0J family partition protein [Actinomycetota bacterium]MCG2788728.1 ParB/RepB/Spo0J family partition protein [Actinomycetes bacterium]
MANRGLGRGLSALIPGMDSKSIEDKLQNRIVELPLVKVTPNKNQPRQNFKEQSLNELAESIREFGIIQPIMVRSLDGGGLYEIISGERRYKAAKMLGLTTVPCIINQNVDDIASIEMALIENIQRDDLTPIELSHTFKQLIDEFKLTHEELSKRISKSRAAITNSLRLLMLPLEVQKMVDAGSLSAGHARTLLSLENKEEQIKLANQIVEQDLSVRRVEGVVRSKVKAESSETKLKKKLPEFEKLPEVTQLVSDYLQAPVNIKVGKRKGKIQILFGSIKDFERIVNRIVGK